MTMRDFRLPDLGEGLTESELVEWHVAPGDTVTLNQTLADVETAKAIVQLPSPVAGVVRELLAEPGSTVAVGSVIVRFTVDAAAGSPGDAGSKPDAAPGAEPAAEPSADDAHSAPTRNAVLVGYGPKVETGARPTRKPRTFRERPAPVPIASAARGSIALAAPPVRKLAHELGIDLARLQGSGEGGTIVRADVTRAAETQGESVSRASDPAATAPNGETRVPIRGVRKATAAAMVASAFTAPHVTEFFTVDVTRSTELIARLTASGTPASLLSLVSKAVCLAMEQSPSLNSRWDDDAGEIIQFASVDLGIAVATERGLMVPCIRGADRMSLPQLTEAIAALAGSARSGEIAPEQLRGSTFTITNIGVFGVDAGTPILNPGEAGILAMGAVRRTPWEFEGEIALRDVMTLSLSFDHRLVDGEHGARFLTAIGGLLADPATAMAHV